MNSDIKAIIESGRADNLIYTYTQLLDLRADFISRVNEAEGKYHIRLDNAEQVVYPKDELQAMVAEEFKLDETTHDYPFVSNFFSNMLVSDILIETKMKYPNKLDSPTKNPNTDKLIDITKDELVSYVAVWYMQLKERKSDD